MKFSEAGAKYTAEKEGIKLHIYNDLAGHATIGCGHLLHKGPADGSEPEWAKKGITVEYALALLIKDAEPKAEAVDAMVKVPLTQLQFDMLVDFCFNLGEHSLEGSSALHFINENQFDKVPAALRLWNKARVDGKLVVVKGLDDRRVEEGAAFLTQGEA